MRGQGWSRFGGKEELYKGARTRKVWTRTRTVATGGSTEGWAQFDHGKGSSK